jgi:hypothetical protein
MDNDCGDWDLESQYEDRNGDPDFNTSAYNTDNANKDLLEEDWVETNDCDCPPCIAGDEDNCVYMTDEDVW